MPLISKYNDLNLYIKVSRSSCPERQVRQFRIRLRKVRKPAKGVLRGRLSVKRFYATSVAAEQERRLSRTEVTQRRPFHSVGERVIQRNSVAEGLFGKCQYLH